MLWIGLSLYFIGMLVFGFFFNRWVNKMIIFRNKEWFDYVHIGLFSLLWPCSGIGWALGILVFNLIIEDID